MTGSGDIQNGWILSGQPSYITWTVLHTRVTMFVTQLEGIISKTLLLEGVRVSGGIDPHILNLGSRQR